MQPSAENDPVSYYINPEANSLKLFVQYASRCALLYALCMAEKSELGEGKVQCGEVVTQMFIIGPLTRIPICVYSRTWFTLTKKKDIHFQQHQISGTVFSKAKRIYWVGITILMLTFSWIPNIDD